MGELIGYKVLRARRAERRRRAAETARRKAREARFASSPTVTPRPRYRAVGDHRNAWLGAWDEV